MKRILLSACFALCLCLPVLADVYTVNSTTDAVDSTTADNVCQTAGGLCTLRAAVQQANAHAGADQINIPAGTYTLTIAGAGENAAATGDLDITESITIQRIGAGTVRIQAGGLDRAFHITAGTVIIKDVVISGGTVSGDGGAILNAGTLTLTRVQVRSSTATASNGGGIYSGVSLTMQDCTVSGNSANVGGGIFFASGSASLDSVTISGNNAVASGGGVRDNNMLVNLHNVTISGNTAPAGGGLEMNGGGIINLFNSTIANNTAASGAGISRTVGNVTLLNTVLADNIGPDCTGTLFSSGYNLIEDMTGCAVGLQVSDITGVDPELLPLSSNGGYVQTHSMLSSSPLIDTGEDATCESEDARSQTRAGLGNACDIGAYEFSCMSWGTTGPTDVQGPGDVESITYDPTNPMTIYASWNDFGVQKSTDGGATWQAASNGLTTFYTSAVAVNPITPSTLYAATSTDIFKSTNSGANWAALNSGVSNPNFSDIVINPLDPTILYAAAYLTGIFKSTDSGATWNPSSTGILPADMALYQLAIDPVNPQTVFVTTVGAAGTKVYRSVNSGGNWTPFTVASGNGSGLELDRNNPTVLYVAKYPECVMKSTDGGSTWNAANAGLPAPLQCWDVAVNPFDSSIVYAAGDQGVFRSQDAGASWSYVENGMQENSLLAITVVPIGPGVAFSGGVDSSVFSLDVPSLYCDDFEDGDASDWTLSGKGANWTVNSGELVGTATKKGDILAPFSGCVTCTINTYVNLLDSDARASIHGWYMDKLNRVELLIQRDKGKVALKQKIGGVTVAKKKASVFLTTNKVYNFGVVFDGVKFYVYERGSLLFSMNAAGLPGSGTAGYRAKSLTGLPSSISIRELVVN